MHTIWTAGKPLLRGTPCGMMERGRAEPSASIKGTWVFVLVGFCDDVVIMFDGTRFAAISEKIAKMS